MSFNPAAVSAPGKVLLAGGYLVLDRKHTGLVFGLNARIHVHVSPVRTSDGVSLQEIVVRSPQFVNATWRYGYHLAPHNGGVEVTQLEDTASLQARSNEFVQTALSYALSYVCPMLNPPIIGPANVIILADNDYYSQDGVLQSDSVMKPSKFRNFNMSIWDAHKTGLGSSAALVTSLVGSVLSYYLSKEQFSLTTDAGMRRLHNLAQIAHSAAQGKVGSGFDVAAATFGSCVYRRFSPSLLENLGEIGSTDFTSRLRVLVDETSKDYKWDTDIFKSAVTVPKGLRLIMCDVDCGSKTPGMVKQVLEWRKTCPEAANDIWSRLQSKNDELADKLMHLADQAQPNFEMLRKVIEDIRTLVRQMSELSGVPIEPQAQTKLLDACSQIEGVVGGVAPGAGGYDAVALLIKDDEEVVRALSDFVASWKFQGDETNTSKPGKVRMLGVREEMVGIKAEDASKYSAWTD